MGKATPGGRKINPDAGDPERDRIVVHKTMPTPMMVNAKLAYAKLSLADVGLAFCLAAHIETAFTDQDTNTADLNLIMDAIAKGSGTPIADVRRGFHRLKAAGWIVDGPDGHPKFRF